MSTALITGASRGIGRGIAKSFAKNGWDLILTCRRSVDALKDLKESLEKEYGVRILASVGDIAEEDYVTALFQEVRETFSRLDVLVNNAGVDHMGLLQDLPKKEWDRILAVNLTAPYLCIKAAIPLMRDAGGSIVNISSVYGAFGASYEAAYAASKGGIDTLTRSLAKELAPLHIRVNAVCPGAIDTDMNAVLSKEDRDLLCEEIPAGRFGTPEEVGALVFAIATAHPYLTGQRIALDGGWL